MRFSGGWRVRPISSSGLRERDRLQREVANLVGSIAAGVPATTVAPEIRTREAEIARLDHRLRAPRPTPDRDRLRDAILQRVAEWRQVLRGRAARRARAAASSHRAARDDRRQQDARPHPENQVEWRAERKREALTDGIVDLVASPAGLDGMLDNGRIDVGGWLDAATPAAARLMQP